MNALLKLTLKSSAIGALGFFAITSGCSSSTDDNTGAGGDSGTTGGSNSTAGKSSSTAGQNAGGDDTGTTAGTGGKSSGTAGAADGGASKGGAPDIEGSAGGPDITLGMGGDSAGGAGTGPAVAKFCNTLTFGGDPTTMILQVGEGASKVTFTAVSGKCVPADGKACTEIPVGDDTNIQLFDADDPTTALDAAPVNILAGQDWIFYTDVQDGQPIWDGGTIKAGSGISCEDITYDDI